LTFPKILLGTKQRDPVHSSTFICALGPAFRVRLKKTGRPLVEHRRTTCHAQRRAMRIGSCHL